MDLLARFEVAFLDGILTKFLFFFLLGGFVCVQGLDLFLRTFTIMDFSVLPLSCPLIILLELLLPFM